jgi:hypothetical protein
MAIKAVREGWSVTLGQPWPLGGRLRWTDGDETALLVPVDEGTRNEVLDTWTYDLREVDEAV